MNAQAFQIRPDIAVSFLRFGGVVACRSDIGAVE
jgi:hypothetical protein